MNTLRIVWKQDGSIVETPIESGLTLAQHLYVSGAFQGRPLCSGAGGCGLCRVRYLSGAPEPLPEERGLLSPARLDEGYRLSCRRPPVPGSTVEASRGPDGEPRQVAAGSTREDAADCGGSGADSPMPAPGSALGIDLGTTSIHWRFEGPGGARGGSFRNPQLGAGSEVMSRLALARSPHGAARLREGVVRAVRDILQAAGARPQCVCVAGNTCMIYLALGMDVAGLSGAPYRVDWPGGAIARLDGELPEVYIPPLLAPFVGGDVSAGLSALEFSATPPRPPYLLADLGTNGEFALVLADGRVLVASVPMGPALEGVGMASGMMAGPGAAVAFGISPTGLSPVAYSDTSGAASAASAGQPAAARGAAIGGASLRGISGTGYVSLLARLLSLGVVDRSGLFAQGAVSPLAARVGAGITRKRGQPCLELFGGVKLFASDVEALLKVKAAYCAAVGVLLDEAGLSFSGLTEVLLAGALGENIQATDLEALGFFPPGGAARVRAVGNTSLDGAVLAAARPDVRDWLSKLPGRTRLVDVLSKPDFQQLYMDCMRFAHDR